MNQFATDLVQALVTNLDVSENFRIHLEKAMNQLIHHIKPLKYGGSDDVSNLIPLWKPGSTPQNGILSHTVLNNWWLNY